MRKLGLSTKVGTSDIHARVLLDAFRGLPVFGRIQTKESVTKVKIFFPTLATYEDYFFFDLFQVQSAFMIDLNQVSLALRNMTPRSLLIIDEFGKGTLAAGSFTNVSER